MNEYDTDFVLWSGEQAELLRQMGAGPRVSGQPDWENIAEEIECLGKKDRRELSRRVHNILRHLFKLSICPAAPQRGGWRRFVIEQRANLRRLLEDSPCLLQQMSYAMERELGQARTQALLDLAELEEQPTADPDGLTFDVAQVLGPWLPD